MPLFPTTGKIQNDFYKEFVFPWCGAGRPEVITGPQYGVDVSVITLPNGLGMALTSDPLSLVPSLGLRESAWLSVQLMANDMATTGFAPMYAQFVLTLPPSLSAEDFETYWKHIDEFCKRLDTAITGGHTGKFEGQNSTIAGGGTMVTIAPAEKIITSKGATPGDVLIMTKECAMLSSAILAMSFPETLTNAVGKGIQQHACDLFYETSSVEAGTAAGRFNDHAGGVTAMHDVTEGGVLGAVYELACAAGCGVRIELDKIPVGTPQQMVCRHFGIDPYYSVGAGSMIITARPEKASMLTGQLRANGIKATVIGQVTEQAEGLHLVRDNEEQPLEHPGVDPYWKAFFDALKNGWR